MFGLGLGHDWDQTPEKCRGHANARCKSRSPRAGGASIGGGRHIIFNTTLTGVQEVTDPEDAFGVEPVDRLVEHHQFRITKQGSGNT